MQSMLLMMMLADPVPCAAIGDGHYVCPNADALLVPATEDEEITIHVRTDAEGSGGWECVPGWCTLDYGLVEGDDDVPLPGQGAQCDEQAPDTCEDPPPPTNPPGRLIGGGKIILRPKGDPRPHSNG